MPAVGTVLGILTCSVQSITGGMKCGGLDGVEVGRRQGFSATGWTLQFCEGICEEKCYRATMSGRLHQSSQEMSENSDA